MYRFKKKKKEIFNTISYRSRFYQNLKLLKIHISTIFFINILNSNFINILQNHEILQIIL